MNERSGPLTDVRVLDLTVAWAGPMATRSLAWLGADVIKIEPPRRPDGWRGFLSGGAPHQYPDLKVGLRPYNRNLLFNTQGHDKRSLALDLKAPGGLELFHRLVTVSDVVIANFTPGTLDRLGIGYDALKRVNKHVIVVEMPAFGSTGPLSNHQGMGKTMEAASGMASLMGYGDDLAPVLTGPAILDPIGGLNGAAAVLTALELRAEQGHGCHVEVPQTEAAVHWIGELVLDAVEHGRLPVHDGNHVPGAVPHDAYPALGEDEWVVVAVRNDAEWAALCQVLGRPDLASDPRYAAAEDRARHQAEIDDLVGAWTVSRSKRAAAAQLQDAGVPSAPVCDGVDVALDPGLAAAGFTTTLTHPEAGTHAYPGLAFRLERTPGGMRTAAPTFGQHNDEVLVGLLGLNEDELAALRSTGTVADAPVVSEAPPTPRRGE